MRGPSLPRTGSLATTSGLSQSPRSASRRLPHSLAVGTGESGDAAAPGEAPAEVQSCFPRKTLSMYPHSYSEPPRGSDPGLFTVLCLYAVLQGH